ncbi:MAG: hypothetical protein PHT25_04345 [Bacteroidales bacterium]|nr:hypothetical protein [Bacteroidales bacterium]
MIEERLQYKIADRVFRIFFQNSKLVSDSLPEFSLFQDFQESPESPVQIFCTYDSESISCFEKEPEKKLIHKFELGDDLCRLSKQSGRYSFTIENPDGKIILLCKMDLGSSDVNIYMERGEVRPSHFKFTIWTILAFTGIPNHYAPVHSSVIVYKGKAILFLGESGTGKSTHTKLWTKLIPDSSLLNDDSPILTIKDNFPFVYGSPWSGKGQCYVNSAYPVAAIVRIKQSKENKIELLSGVGAFCALYPSFPPAFFKDPYFENNICEFISAIIKEVPVYTLHCLPDREAAYLVLDTVYKSPKESI